MKTRHRFGIIFIKLLKLWAYYKLWRVWCLKFDLQIKKAKNEDPAIPSKRYRAVL